MKQPELGKKITELRLAKGLTQSELAEKCNVGLRTIQRIESAKVTPRSYTLKLIFKNVDFEAFNRSERKPKTADWHILKIRTHPWGKWAFLSISLTSLVLFFSLSGFQENNEVLPPYSFSELNIKYVDWFNSGQIDSIGLLYLNNACAIPYNHEEIHGRKNIVKWYRSLYESGFRLYKRESKAIIETDSILIERGVWHGNNQINMTGTYLAQWRRLNGRWYQENSMSNGDSLYK